MKKLVYILAAFGCSSQAPSSTPPPSWGVPITGGTMLVTKDGAHAVIADPDRDQIVSVDLTTQKVAAQLQLSPGEEPGRIAEDGAGRIHVALRRGGALLNLSDAATLKISSRVQVCPEPRGVAWEPSTDLVHVACTGGELISIPSSGTTAVRTLRLDRDLRDVVVSNNTLYVSRFRSAELLQLDAQGKIASRIVPPTVTRLDLSGAPSTGNGTIPAVPAVAWRTVAMPDGRLLIMHQRQLKTVLHPSHGGYGAGCGGMGGGMGGPGGSGSGGAGTGVGFGGAGNGAPVEDAITVVTPGGAAPFAMQPVFAGALPVDLAVSPDGNSIAMITAGNQTVHVFAASSLSTGDDDQCGGGDDGQGDSNDQLGAPTSIQYTPNGLLVFYPELPAVVLHAAGGNTTIRLPGQIGYDSGRALFHTQTQVGIACASCHPEARDDGLVWEFENEGLRRTQNIAGSIMDRAPYHWSGDMPDLPTLMDNVFAVRMAGPQPTNSQHLSLGPFLNRVAAPVAPMMTDPQAVSRGKALFESAEVACTTCHNGPLLTNHQLANVGTGGTFKVPSLIGVFNRPPYLHDGSAPTLFDRFGPVGGGDLHGHTSQLTALQVSDLVSYLETL
jgi:hypothetical protein